ncbi:MAG: outer membrane protein OmpA-like peptidoglycan-associated protein [Gammaproteobacteria bacterium]|jgi:outer membrane protein OmpA-like peptidoglycan-associated protein
MKLITTLTLVLLLSTQFNVNAKEVQQDPYPTKGNVGFGLGALIGGLLAGPPGAVIGAASGTWFGVRETDTDTTIAAQEKELNAQSIELTYQQNELANTKKKFKEEFQQVVNNREIQSLEKLSQGISYVIYYKTNDAEIRTDVLPQIRQLAELIKPYPKIKIQIAGYADHRGSLDFNLLLSKKRADKVRAAFIDAGISNQRFQLQAHGERAATAKQGDKEAYVFDRRVTINLTMDMEA